MAYTDRVRSIQMKISASFSTLCRAVPQEFFFILIISDSDIVPVFLSICFFTINPNNLQ